MPLAEAYSYCGKLARSHYENFTIASWLMPREMRRHMRDHTWSVRVPRGLQEDVLRVNRAVSDLETRLGHSPTAQQAQLIDFYTIVSFLQNAARKQRVSLRERHVTLVADFHSRGPAT